MKKTHPTIFQEHVQRPPLTQHIYDPTGESSLVSWRGKTTKQKQQQSNKCKGKTWYVMILTHKLVLDVVDGQCHGVPGSPLTGRQSRRPPPAHSTTKRHRNQVAPVPPSQKLFT